MLNEFLPQASLRRKFAVSIQDPQHARMVKVAQLEKVKKFISQVTGFKKQFCFGNYFFTVK